MTDKAEHDPKFCVLCISGEHVQVPDVPESKENVEEMKEVLGLLIDAVWFYANPQTYFAIALLKDEPCGEFASDFDETYLGYKPGKRARDTLDRAEALVMNFDDWGDIGGR